MGRTHHISRAAESDTCVLERRSFRLHELHPETPGTLMIHPDTPNPKLTPGIRGKEHRLEPNRGDTDEEAQRLKDAMVHLQESGWYWGSMTAAEAKEVLTEAPDGSFLVRDSSNPGYLLTLSVKTALGPTHLRLEYSAGHFGFDSVVMARPHLRQFKGVLELVQYYMLAYRRQQLTQKGAGVNDHAQTTPDSTLQLQLRIPRHKTPSSLQHLCRVVINQHSQDHRDLPLPQRLKDFLWEYPFIL